MVLVTVSSTKTAKPINSRCSFFGGGVEWQTCEINHAYQEFDGNTDPPSTTGRGTMYSTPITFRCLAVLDPRVGHTMDVLSPFIPVLCHSG